MPDPHRLRRDACIVMYLITNTSRTVFKFNIPLDSIT